MGSNAEAIRERRMMEVREHLALPFPEYAKRCLKIRTKVDGIQPFILNAGQLRLHEHSEAQMEARGFVRTILLKARQWGGSTYIQGRAYRKVTSGSRGTKAFIMTHRLDTTAAIFNMTKRFHDHMPEAFRAFSTGGSKTQLTFPKRDSMYAVGTAGSESVAHGETIQFLHASEFARWPNASDHLAGVFQAVPNQGKETEIYIESTGHGMGNEFYKQVSLARKMMSDYWFLFVPWYWFDEYEADPPDDMIMTPDDEEFMSILGLTERQMAFRYLKIMELGGDETGLALFKAQYPSVPEDAFSTPNSHSYFDVMTIVKARKAQAEPYGQKIMGIDPSHLGGDRFSVCVRQGRRARHVGCWTKKRTTESLPLVVKLIREEKPKIVFVDQGGPGAGIVDPLLEMQAQLSCRVIPVDFGSSADDPERYNNKREEMYGRTKDWFEGAMPVQIDDRDDLQADCTNPEVVYDSRGQPQVESKQRMCKIRGLPSPDLLESLILTHAYYFGDNVSDEHRGLTDQDIDPNRPLNWRTTT